MTKRNTPIAFPPSLLSAPNRLKLATISIFPGVKLATSSSLAKITDYSA